MDTYLNKKWFVKECVCGCISPCNSFVSLASCKSITFLLVLAAAQPTPSRFFPSMSNVLTARAVRPRFCDIHHSVHLFSVTIHANHETGYFTPREMMTNCSICGNKSAPTTLVALYRKRRKKNKQKKKREKTAGERVVRRKHFSFFAKEK